MGHFCPPTRLLCDIINYFYNATLSSMIFTFQSLKIGGCGMSLYRIAFQRHERLWISRVLEPNASRSLNGRWTFHRDDDVSQRQTIAVLGAILRHRRSTTCRTTATTTSARHFTTFTCHLRSFRSPNFLRLKRQCKPYEALFFPFFSGTTRRTHIFLLTCFFACERLRITSKTFFFSSSDRTRKQILIFSIIFCLRTSFTRITFSHFSGFVWWRRINRITGVDIAVDKEDRIFDNFCEIKKYFGKRKSKRNLSDWEKIFATPPDRSGLHRINSSIFFRAWCEYCFIVTDKNWMELCFSWMNVEWVKFLRGDKRV